jgi:membrane protease YdiL (CAAX protease family)
MDAQGAEPTAPEVTERSRPPSGRDAFFAMLAMLGTILVVDVPVRLILDELVKQKTLDLPYNPALVRIAGSALTQLVEVAAVLLGLALLFRITRYGSFADLGLGRSKLKWLPLGVFTPIVALLLAALIAYATGLVPIDRLLFPGPWPVLLIFAASTHAAVIEEIGFRGVLMQGIERMSNRTVAILVSGLLFASLHVLAPFTLTWPWWIAVTAAGLGFGWAFYASGRSLWLTIGLHWGFDMGVFLLLGLPGESRGWLRWPASSGDPALSSQAGAVMLIGLVLTAVTLWLVLGRKREVSA